ncbi:cobalt ECF transporter T component CbiQ [Zavarzinia aquatilis]|uniref:Cobalt ECF transporter T component CbiQ n=2 Tax=Zavarzinia aquatilis TaxID=2211142 RepID=A0A317E8F5_9PROT|nr:cobalt ECF transporter T component CbiQ [Zavarzinia aquatilis]
MTPRARLLATLILTLAVVALRGLPAQGAALAGAFALALISGQALRPLLHRLAHVEGFMVLLLVMLPFSVPGTPLVTLGPLVLSAEGLARAIGIALKTNAAILIVFALLGTVEPLRLGHAARGLGAPVRLVQLFLFTTRYVELFRDEIRRRREAMRARAFARRTSLHTFRAYGNLAGMVLVRALEKAARVEEAMRCRAFDGRLPAIGIEEGERGILAGPGLALVVGAALIALDRLP